mmetsp:Transcript_74349/g.140702  ORF Transcript_74349/g.140702 Transcript_74349/m.140702 type:complete len:317 (+) Transcript_74349:419-1369(+)
MAAAALGGATHGAAALCNEVSSAAVAERAALFSAAEEEEEEEEAEGNETARDGDKDDGDTGDTAPQGAFVANNNLSSAPTLSTRALICAAAAVAVACASCLSRSVADSRLCSPLQFLVFAVVLGPVAAPPPALDSSLALAAAAVATAFPSAVVLLPMLLPLLPVVFFSSSVTSFAWPTSRLRPATHAAPVRPSTVSRADTLDCSMPCLPSTVRIRSPIFQSVCSSTALSSQLSPSRTESAAAPSLLCVRSDLTMMPLLLLFLVWLLSLDFVFGRFPSEFVKCVEPAPASTAAEGKDAAAMAAAPLLAAAVVAVGVS